MKLKLKQLNPNPYKKSINKGRLDNETIKKIRANIKDLGLMGSIPIIKKNNKYYLVSHHHRVEALKREFGKDFEVEVDIKKYSDEQLLKGMVIENLTQRNNEYSEEEDNILAIKKYLIKNKILLDDKGTIVHPSDSRYIQSGGKSGLKGSNPEYGSVRQICLWLDKGTGDVLRKSTISDRLSVYEHLNPELKEKIEKRGGGKAPDNVVTVKQATELVRITKNPEEQEDLWKAMKKEDGRPHELLTDYKNAPEEIKEKVRKGEVNLKDIKEQTEKEMMDKKAKEIKNERDNEIRIKKTEEVLSDLRDKIDIEFSRINKLMFLVGRVRKTKLYLHHPKEKENFFKYIDGIIKRTEEWSKELRRLKDNLELEIIST